MGSDTESAMPADGSDATTAPARGRHRPRRPTPVAADAGPAMPSRRAAILRTGRHPPRPVRRLRPDPAAVRRLRRGRRGASGPDAPPVRAHDRPRDRRLVRVRSAVHGADPGAVAAARERRVPDPVGDRREHPVRARGTWAWSGSCSAAGASRLSAATSGIALYGIIATLGRFALPLFAADRHRGHGRAGRRATGR